MGLSKFIEDDYVTAFRNPRSLLRILYVVRQSSWACRSVVFFLSAKLYRNTCEVISISIWLDLKVSHN